jgi:DNA repair protein RecN (Recombination protein N)
VFTRSVVGRWYTCSVLQELRVENLLLIEHAELRLAPGLNVLTGETGSGKTVLAHALDLLLGGRARAGIVRPGAQEAYVEGVFDLTDELREALGERIAADAEELVLARRVGADGRTRAYIGGRAATVGDLRDLAAGVLAFYGQHEHRRLTVAGAQLRVLDDLSPEHSSGLLAACAQAHARVRELAHREQELAQLAGQRERELDLLEYELAEIDSVAPVEGEREQLLALRERARRSEALCAAAAAGAAALAPDGDGAGGGAGVRGGLAGSLAQMRALAGVDPDLDTLAERLGSLEIELDDLAGELRAYAAHAGGAGALARSGAPAGEEPDLPADLSAAGDHPRGAPGSLEEIEERLSAIERLMRKHGGSVAAVLEFSERSRERHAALAGADEALERTAAELAQAREQLSDAAGALHDARAAAAERLSAEVREQLAELAMPDATFAVGFERREPGADGADAVEFMIAPNPGVPAAPVREIASGGELSRVMLAIMSVAQSAALGRTLVFDEVDAGIGGHTARAVGTRLRTLAEGRQVLCITHLPQIASLGDRHFAIVKDTNADPTRASVVQLQEPDVLGELVRMLGADGDDSSARRHARELRRAA